MKKLAEKFTDYLLEMIEDELFLEFGYAIDDFEFELKYKDKLKEVIEAIYGEVLNEVYEFLDYKEEI